MARAIEAVYEHGAFRPLEPVELTEGKKVRLSVDVVEEGLTPDEMLALARKVYEGLSEENIREIEAIALDRSNFSRKLEEGNRDGTRD